MKKIITLLILVITAIVYVVFLNITFDKSELENLNNGEVTVIGHAGLGFTSWIPFNPYPANSFTALKNAIVASKADGVEVDLHMTKDGEFVLYHDEKLDNKTNGIGCLSQFNLNELEKVNYKVGWPFDWFQSEKLIGLDSLVTYFKTLPEFPIIQLDIRNKSLCLTAEENAERELVIAKRLISKIAELEIPKDKILFISLSMEFTSHLRNLKNPYATSFEIVADEDFLYEYAFENDFESVTVKSRILSKEVTKTIHSKGFKLITFGAKSKSGNKKLLQLNPDVIQTNNIEALKELLE